MKFVCTVESSYIKAKDGLTNFNQHIIAKCGRDLDYFVGRGSLPTTEAAPDRDNQSP